MRPRPVGATSAPSNRREPASALDARLRERFAPLGITFTWSPSLLLGTVAIGLFLASLRVGGLMGMGVVAIVLCAGWLSVDCIAALMVQRRSDRLLPDLALRLARSLRSGLPPERAIEQAALELDGGHQRFGLVAAQVSAGRPVTLALAEWLRTACGDAEQLLAAGLLLGIEHGGDLAKAIDGVGEGLRDDLDLDARRRVLLTQSRVSAAVLVALPVVFALVASALNGGSIYQGRFGYGLLLAGIGLDVIGIFWMRSLMGGLR